MWHRIIPTAERSYIGKKESCYKNYKKVFKKYNRKQNF